MTVPNEFDDTPETDVNLEAPVKESAGEYGYSEPPATPAPTDDVEQNPGAEEGSL